MKEYKDIEYNYHDYSDSKIYITLGINVGVATRYFLIDGKKEYISNLSFANILTNYLKLILGQELVVNVDRTITHLTYISKQETFEEDFLRFIRTIFASDKDAELFETSKKNTIEKFRKNYKNGEFRALYKAFEYSDANKGYKLYDLIEGLQKINYETFINENKLLMVGDGSYAV